jgi:hypothetical protein
MCGRYVSPEPAEIERFWHIGQFDSNPFPRRFNVSPVLIIPILLCDYAPGEIKLVDARPVVRQDRLGWVRMPRFYKSFLPGRAGCPG